MSTNLQEIKDVMDIVFDKNSKERILKIGYRKEFVKYFISQYPFDANIVEFIQQIDDALRGWRLTSPV